MNPTLKKLLPHLIAYLVLLIVSFIRFAPIVFEGKALQQGDNIQAYGMQAEMRKIEEKTGEYPLWTNSAFSGMPTYQILYPSTSPTHFVSKIFLLGNSITAPHTSILLIMAGIYLLFIVLGVDWRISIFGAIGFGLAANHLGLAEAGHSTKLIATAFVAPTLAGIILTYRGKYFLGGGLTALFMALQILANHMQITYYLLIAAFILGVLYFFDALRKGTLNNFLKATAIAVASVVLGFAANMGRLWTTYEYSQETIRGKSELKQKGDSSGSAAGEGGGLSRGYAFGWSYGVLETYNLLIPNYVGGSSSEGFASDPESATLQVLRQMPPEEGQRLAQEATHYWGAQPFTSGGLYFGAVFIFLFFLGAFLVKNPVKWWVLIFVLLAIMLALGKNLPAFNYFIFDRLPMYNKFRDVKMVLGIANLLVVLLGVLGLQAFFDKNLEEKERKNALYLSGAIAGGLVLLGLLISFGLDYVKEGENFPPALAAAIAEDRAALLRTDALRSLIFIALAFGVLAVYLKRNWKPLLAAASVGVLAVIDVWGIGTRFINSDDYVSNTDKQRMIAPTEADEQIMKDPDPYYRVADFRRNPFSNALTSYFHKSMGGYHAAKLMRYQELIERYLGDPMKNQHIYGMLNGKYFITQGDQVYPNPNALGNAWFVKEYEIVPDGDAEIAALANLNPSEKAVVQQQFADRLQGLNVQYDSAATIRLTHYHPDTMIYQYSAPAEQLAVFSEVYYPPSKGWNMYLDGQKTEDFIKANFLLRAARLPGGQHEVKMVFAPKSFHTGETISLIASLLAILAAIGGVVIFTRKYEIPRAENLPEGEAVKVKPKAVKPVPTASKRKKK